MKNKNVAGVSFTSYMCGIITFRKRAEMIQLNGINLRKCG